MTAGQQRAVWKFGIVTAVADIRIPQGAQVKHFATQDGELVFWAEVDLTAPLVTVRFRVINTGGRVHPSDVYRGTASVGSNVWHLYEEVTG